MTEFLCERNALVKALNVTGRVIGKNIVPAVECFLFEVQGNECIITGSNFSIFIRKKIEVKSEIVKPVKFCVPEFKFTRLLKTLPNQVLNFKLSSKKLHGKVESVMELIYSTGEAKFSMESGEAFPPIPVVEDMGIIIDNQELICGFDKTTFANDPSEMSALNNSLLIFGNGLSIIGANFNMASATKVFQNTVNLKEITLPKNSLDIMYGIGANGNTNVSYSDNNICFRMEDGTEVYARTADVKYPDIVAVINKVKTQSKIVLNTEEFLAAIKRAVIFTMIASSVVEITLSDEGMLLQSQNESGEYCKEKISCEYSGDLIEIGFVSEKLISILQKVKSPDVIMEFLDPQTPVLIKEEETESRDNIFVLTPISLTRS